MPRNDPDDLIRFARLSYDVVSVAEVEDALAFADDMLTFLSPVDSGDPRSERAEALRVRAELLFACAEIYDLIAPYLALTTPGKEILSTMSIQIGTDFPTPVDYQNAMARAADRYRERATALLKMVSPVTAVIE